MKLIDKEKLLEDLKSKRYSKQSLELIQSQPEVKAIPNHWLIDHYLHGFSRAGCQTRYMTVKEILEEWERVNENEKSV